MISMHSADRTPDGVDALVTCDIAQLEELFAARKENAEALRDLECELRYRRSPQALALLSRIHDHLAACGWPLVRR